MIYWARQFAIDSKAADRTMFDGQDNVITFLIGEFQEEILALTWQFYDDSSALRMEVDLTVGEPVPLIEGMDYELVAYPNTTQKAFVGSNWYDALSMISGRPLDFTGFNIINDNLYRLTG